MSSAAERAADVLAESYARAWDDRRYMDGLGIEAQVAALMADPDLLVDLAIEAGGLEPDGSYWLPDDWEDEGDGRSGVYYDDDAPEKAEPLYRAPRLHAAKAELVSRYGTPYPRYAHVDEATSRGRREATDD